MSKINKSEFLSELRVALSEITNYDVEERLAFYSEMIDDLVDDGISEEEAIEKVGPVDKIAREALGAIPLFELVKRKVKPKRSLRGWEIGLICASSLIWVPLVISLFAVAIALFVSVWSIVISLWAALLTSGASALAGLFCGVLFIFTESQLSGFVLCGASITVAGLSILLFYGCKLATKGTAVLTKMAILGIKRLFV